MNNEEKSRIESIILKCEKNYKKTENLVELKTNNNIYEKLLNLIKQIIYKFDMLKNTLKGLNFNPLTKNQVKTNEKVKIYKKMKEIKNLAKFKEFKKENENLFKDKDSLKNNVENMIENLKKDNTNLIKEFQKLNDDYCSKDIFITKLENTIRNLEKEQYNPDYKISDNAITRKSKIKEEVKTLKEEASKLKSKRNELLRKQEKIVDAIYALEYMLEKDFPNKEDLELKLEKLNKKLIEIEKEMNKKDK